MERKSKTGNLSGKQAHMEEAEYSPKSSDSEYTDCESYSSSDDNYDFDPTVFFDNMNGKDFKEVDLPVLDKVHILLQHDIQTFRELFMPPEMIVRDKRKDSVNKKKNESADESRNELKQVELGLSFRLLESLGEIDCDIQVPVKDMNLAPQIANAWKIHLDEPLVVRFNFSCQNYLDNPDPPKVEVFQPNKKECGIAPQLKNIMTLFLKDIWHKTDNSVLQSHLRHSGSIPVHLSSLLGATSVKVSKELKRLLEMGFEETEARNALSDSNNSLMEASILLAINSSSGSDLQSTDQLLTVPDAAALPTERTSFPADSKLSKTFLQQRSFPSPSHMNIRKKPVVRSLTTSVTEPNLRESAEKHLAFEDPASLDAKKAPSLADGFLVMLYRYICQRVPRLNEFCVVCDCPHVFQTSGAMLMPSVCSRELCLFAFQTLGVMANATAEIATGAEVVDLLITMAKAACFSLRQAIILNPFPNIVDPENENTLALSDKKKDFRKVESLMQQLPPLSDLTSFSRNSLHEQLDKKDRLLYPLLSWIIYSNRSHIVKLSPEKQLKFMGTPHQYLLLSSPPAQEKEFQDLKAKYGTIFAFHGSGIENWHAIIRQGLIVATGTRYQVHGAAHGKGIYLSPRSSFSFIYSGMGYGVHDLRQKKCKNLEKHRFLSDSHLNCMALCEVINSPEVQKKTSDIWVVGKESHVCTRFFFVYEDGQVGSNSVDMTNEKYKKLVEDALASCYMPIVTATETDLNITTALCQ